MKTDHRLFKVLLTALIIPAFFFMFFLWMTSHRWDSRFFLGIELKETGSGLVVTGVKEGSPAQKRGVQTGDLLVDVMGERITDISRYRFIERKIYRQKTVLFSFQRQGTKIEVVLAPEVRLPWMMTLPTLIIVMVYLGVGLLSLWRGIDDLRLRLLFMMTLFASLTVIIPDYYARQYGGLDFIILNFLLFFSYGALIGLEPHLAMVIPEKKMFIREHPWFIRSLYIWGLTLSAVLFLAYLDSICGFSLPEPVACLSARLFPVTYQIAVPLLVFGSLLHTFLKTPAGVAKTQTKVVLFGVLPWMVSMVASSLFNLIGGSIPGFMILFNLICIIPVPFAFLIGILKYRLFNVELVIRKSLVYALLTGLLFLVYYGTLGIGSGLFTLVFAGGDDLWVMAFATLMLGLLFNPLRRKIQWYVDKFFYPEKFELRRKLPEISKQTASAVGLEELVLSILENLSRLLYMEDAAFLLSDDNRETFYVILSRGKISSRGLEHEIVFPAGEGIMAGIAGHKRPVTVRELYRHSGIQNNPDFEKMNAGLIIPFHLKDHLIGALILGGDESDVKLDREDRDLLAIFSNQVAAMIENARLFRSATRDDLTGLYRRNVFEQILLLEIERSGRFGHPLVVGMVDVDYFKRVNDSLGHAAGDIVLKKTAFLLEQNIRSIDCLARYGGEEFVFLLPETDSGSGRAIGEKLRCIIEKSDFSLPGAVRLPEITVSIGLAFWDGRGETTVNGLLECADQALYKAKENGRNRIEGSPFCLNQ